MKTFLLARYIGKTVLLSILMALLLVAGLDSLGALISENNNYIGQYTFSEGVLYILLLFPSTVNEYVPFACLIGCLMGLGTLASNSELVVMRSAGVSTRKIVLLSLIPAVFILLLDMVLQEWVSPDVSRYAETRRGLLQYGDIETKKGRAARGIWIRDKNSFIHINIIDPDGVLYGVTVFEFSEHGQLQRSMYAATAEYKKGQNIGSVQDQIQDETWNETGSDFKGDWLLKNVDVSAFYVNEQKDEIVSSNVKSLPLDISLKPELLDILAVSPEQLSPSGLYSYMNYLAGQGVDAGEYELAFWQKIFQPLAGIALVLVAASFIFGPLRESTTGYRVFMAVIVGIVFNTSQDLLGPSSLVFGFPSWLAILMPIVVYMLLGLYLVRRSA